MSEIASKVIDPNMSTPPWTDRGRRLDPRGADLATTVYAGLFQALDPTGYFLWNTPSLDSLSAKCRELSADGLTLKSIATRQIAGQTWFLGTWTLIAGGWGLWRTNDWSAFTSKVDEWKGSMRLLDLDIQIADGHVWYTGTWGGSPIAQTIVADLSWDDFTAQWKTLSAQGQRLTRVQIFPSQDSWHLTGIFEPGTDGYALLRGTNWNDFYAYYQQNISNMNLIDFQVYDDGTTRWYIGVWRQLVAEQNFLFNQDWGSFVAQWEQLAKSGMILQKAISYSSANEPPSPQWASVYASALDSAAEGYAYAVLQGGQVSLQSGEGYSRAAQDAPQTEWTPQTRLNLASVSKSVTAVAVMKLLADYNISLDDPFYPHVSAQFPTVGSGVDTVTIRNLLEMKSGMPVDGTLYTSSIWTFLTGYLQQNAVDPGHSPAKYSNTNFTILQAVIDCVTGHGGQTPDYYPTYVSDNVLTPMGIDTSVFNTVPDAESASTLSYSGASDTTAGKYWPQLTCTAAGGWISSAEQLAKFVAGVRACTVLSQAQTSAMLEGELGWYLYDGIYGPYYHHNGGLTGGETPAKGLKTGIILLAEGYDALLLVNTWFDGDPIPLMIKAFESGATS